ncbi:heterokaryon incompatibility protein-domain-containing protein [Camillea tinctor]|nr:heterokaryon incompatibility protein-domain-containing protein [Camillea tinctor]
MNSYSLNIQLRDKYRFCKPQLPKFKMAGPTESTKDELDTRPDEDPPAEDRAAIKSELGIANEDKSDVPEWKVDNDYSFYQPLDQSQKEIRLVTISPGDFNEPLHCTLVRHSDSWAETSYESLSYCWGDLGDTTCITLRHNYGSLADPTSESDKCNEQKFNITKNLDQALRYLRFEDKPRVLWIDALCINQGSIRERNYAIPFMVDVYRSAECVLVFLGEERQSEHFQGMWDLLNMLNAAVERAGVKPLWQHQDIDKTLDEIKIVPRIEGTGSDSGLTTFRMHMSMIFSEFFNKFPWFRRVWVVQEVMNAKRAIVYCGKQQRDWLDILVMLCWAAKSSRSYAAGWSGTHMYDELPPFLWTRLHAARHGDIERPARVPLLDAITKGRAFQATDPRDKIIALLSFGEDTHDIAGLPPRLKPDYGKTASGVWRDMTRQWIIDHRSLDILGIIREKIDRNNQVAANTIFITQLSGEESKKSSTSGAVELPPDGHPSWALWHAEHPGSAPQALFRLQNPLSSCSIPLDIATLDNPKDPNILNIPGTILNPITSVQWAFKRWTYTDEDMRQFNHSKTPALSVQSGVPVAWGILIGAIDELSDDSDAKQIAFSTRGRGGVTIEPYPNGSSLIQAFVEALICRRLSKRWFLPEQPMSLDSADPLPTSERADLQTLAHFAAHWARGCDPEMGWIPGQWAERLRALAKHGSSRAFTEMCGYAEDRCFFRTKRAGFGLCAQGARAGDYVASLAGGGTPFVLRPLEVRDGRASRFGLVGECYLHDLDIRRVTQAAVDRGDVDTVCIV